MNKKLFLILAEPRTGTSLVNDRMSIFDHIVDLGEVFKDQVDLFKLQNAFHKSDCHIVAKILSFHISLDDLKKILEWPNVEIIYITRKDKLASYVSWIKAFHHNLWHEVDTSDFAVEINIDEYNDWYNSSIEWHKNIDNILSTKENVLRIGYEDLLEDFDESKFRSVMETWFIQIGAELSYNGRQRKFGFKQRKKPLEHSIKNFDQVIKTCQRF